MKKKAKKSKNIQFDRSFYFLIIGIIVIIFGAIAYFYKPTSPSFSTQQFFKKSIILNRKFIYQLDTQLFVYDFARNNTSEIKNITLPISWIGWSDNGKKLAILNTNGTLYLVNPDTYSSRVLLTEYHGTILGWDVKSEGLLLERNFLDGQEVTTLSTGREETKTYHLFPDGTVKDITDVRRNEIAFPRTGVYKYASIDGRYENVITPKPENEFQISLVDTQSKNQQYQLPQDTYISFLSKKNTYIATKQGNGAPDRGDFQILKMTDITKNIIDKPLYKTTHVMNFDWLSNQKIVLLKQTNNYYSISLMDITTLQEQPLTEKIYTPFVDFSVFTLFDEKTILFTYPPPPPPGGFTTKAKGVFLDTTTKEVVKEFEYSYGIISPLLIRN